MSEAEQRAERAAREIAEVLMEKYDELHANPCGINLDRLLAARRNDIARFAAAIILKHQPAWVSVQERLPELCCELHLAFVPPVIMGLAYRRDGSWFWPRTDEDEEAIGVTHWLPLPAAPRPATPPKKENE